jgi:hypothetical protein
MVGTGRANNCIRIPTSLQGRFFRTWIEYLTPLHNLTNREKDVVAAFVKARFELSKSIIDDTLLDKVLMSDDIKNQIKEECNVSDAFFQVILGKLRKTKIIVDGKLSPIFIPKNLHPDDSSFQLLLYFDLDARNDK